MKKEHIMDAMDYIDPALVAAADAPARGRGGIRWARAALIAACLCLALVGTAVAAVEIIGIRIDWKTPAFLNEEGYSGYGVVGGGVSIPADKFPQEVWDLAEGIRDKDFSTWDEVEQFLGWDLIGNPVLDVPGPGNQPIDRISLTATANEQGLCSIIAYDSHVLDDDVLIRRIVQIHTENSLSLGDPLEEYFGWTFYREGSQTTQTEYTTPSGLQAVIVDAVLDEPGEGRTQRCDAYFSVNGVMYSIGIPDVDMRGDEDAMAVLKRVLDGFILD